MSTPDFPYDVLGGACWPIDTALCPAWDSYSPKQQDFAAALAGQTLQMLTGFRVGGCPVVLRPCRKDCGGPRTWAEFPVLASGSWAGAYTGSLNPTVIGGAWYNITCGCGADGCSCTTVCEIRLPGYPTSVEHVFVDGAELDPSAYRLDNGTHLTRIDGACWPLCQDMNAEVDEPGSFAVIYSPGIEVDAEGAMVAGILACEYASASVGAKCRLPANVTQIVRLGVTMTLTANPFPGNMTGIREIDAYVHRYNPGQLTAPPIIWSPDVRAGRVTSTVPGSP